METENFQVHLLDKKYDIKNFLRDHPGGIKTLQYYKGKSVLEVMTKYNHSSSAYHILNDFIVRRDVVKELVDSNLTGGVSESGRIITKGEDKRNVAEIKFLEALEGRLDWSKPMLSQLHKIAPHYQSWVNSAVYRHCRLFSNPLLELTTFTPWYMVPALWIPVILYLGCTQYLEHVLCRNKDSCENNSLTPFEYIGNIFIGIFLWTIIEYTLHRWIFHRNPGNSLIMIKLHFLIHGLHHKLPFDGLRQVFPPVPAVLLASAIYLPLSNLFSYPLIKLTGGLIGYLTYDMIHYYVHHGSPVDGTYLYAMKRYHSNHHFVNHDKAFGISSKIWDYVFQTYVKVRKLGFSLHW